MTHEEACKLLNVKVDASIKDIKHAFRNKAFEYHTDKHMNEPQEALKIFEEKFKKIKDAFDYLKLESSLNLEIKPNFFSLNDININIIRKINFEIQGNGDYLGEKIDIVVAQGSEWIEISKVRSLLDNVIFPIEVEANIIPMEPGKNYEGKIDVKLGPIISSVKINMNTKFVEETYAGIDRVSSLTNKVIEEESIPNMRLVERLVMLRAIDSLWKDHLTEMDHLRQQAGLQAMRQIEPIVVYKKEGHAFFESLIASIQHDVVHTIYKVSIDKKEAPAQRQPQKVAVPAGKKVGRNESCPCGSGKKYKHCCGR